MQKIGGMPDLYNIFHLALKKKDRRMATSSSSKP
jgi:hypothetical protein